MLISQNLKKANFLAPLGVLFVIKTLEDEQ